MTAESRAAHGEMHKRFDVEEMGQSAEVYRRRAFLKLSPGRQRQIKKTISFGTMYGARAIFVEQFSHRIVESPHGY